MSDQTPEDPQIVQKREAEKARKHACTTLETSCAIVRARQGQSAPDERKVLYG